MKTGKKKDNTATGTHSISPKVGCLGFQAAFWLRQRRDAAWKTMA